MSMNKMNFFVVALLERDNAYKNAYSASYSRKNPATKHRKCSGFSI